MHRRPLSEAVDTQISEVKRFVASHRPTETHIKLRRACIERILARVTIVDNEVATLAAERSTLASRIDKARA